MPVRPVHHRGDRQAGGLSYGFAVGRHGWAFGLGMLRAHMAQGRGRENEKGRP